MINSGCTAKRRHDASRPRPDSQAGRILHLLESANGGKVSLLAILNLRISQYSARIHDLRHKYGFRIENGCDGKPEHTWFRLLDAPKPSAHVERPQNRLQSLPPHVLGQEQTLFPPVPLKWEDFG